MPRDCAATEFRTHGGGNTLDCGRVHQSWATPGPHVSCCLGGGRVMSSCPCLQASSAISPLRGCPVHSHPWSLHPDMWHLCADHSNNSVCRPTQCCLCAHNVGSFPASRAHTPTRGVPCGLHAIDVSDLDWNRIRNLWLLQSQLQVESAVLTKQSQ